MRVHSSLAAGALAMAVLGAPALAMASSATVSVAGQTDPFTAGQADGFGCCGGDVTPAQSPAPVPLSVAGGDVLFIEIEMTKVRGRLGKAKGICKVAGEIVSEAEITFMLRDA